MPNIHAQRNQFRQANISSCLPGHCQPALCPGSQESLPNPALRLWAFSNNWRWHRCGKLYFLVPPVTNGKSLLQFPSPDFSWFNNAPESKHRHPSLSPSWRTKHIKPRNYSWLGLEQPTRCQFYMFYKATACRKPLECRSYQACDPQSNHRLPETVIQGSIIFLQEKWNICGLEN